MRERRTSSVSSFLAAWSSSSGASPPRLLGERDLGLEQIHAGLPELVERPGLRRRQQLASQVERPRPQARLGGCERSVGPPRGIARQRDRALQERRGGGQAAARLRPDGRALELQRRPARRVPPPQRPDARHGGPGRRPDRSPPPVRGGRPGVPAPPPTGRRPSGPAGDGTRACSPIASSPRASTSSAAAGAMPSFAAARQSSSGSPSGSAAASSNRRRASSESACELPDEALLDPSREALRAQQPEAARQLRRREASRQLEQRQRIAPRLGDDPVADPLVELESHRRAEQRAGVAVAHAAHLELGDVLELLARLACGEDDPDRLRQQATGDEGERQRRRLVEPLRVVDDAQQRPIVGRLRDQAQDRQAHEEPVRGAAGAHARTRSRAPVAAAREAAGAGRASARRADARRRRRAPSRTPPRPRARRSAPTPTRPGTSAAPSCRSRPRPAGPATGSRPGGCPRSTRPAGRTRRPAREGSSQGQPPRDRVPVANRAHQGVDQGPTRARRVGVRRTLHHITEPGRKASERRST